MKHIAVVILGLVVSILLASCGKPEVPTSPFGGPSPSSELQVSPVGADSITGKDNAAEFENMAGGTEIAKELSYTADATRALQVIVYSSAANANCDLFNFQTSAEWKPEGGGAVRVKTGEGFLAGENYTVEKGKKYSFRFLVTPPTACDWASFQFRVITP